jgi:hypothetical protein
MAYTIPAPRDAIATPLSVYGNNATVACPCGRVIVVRSMNEPGKGAWKCSCSRWYKGYPENGQAITHILVWERGSEDESPSYRVAIEALPQA